MTFLTNSATNRTIVLQVAAGALLSLAAVNAMPLVVLAYFILVCLLLGLTKNNLAIFLSFLLPVTSWTGFYDPVVTPVPTLETPYGIILMLGSLLVFICMLKGQLRDIDAEPIKPFFPFFGLILISCLFSTSVYRSFGFFFKNYLPLLLYLVGWYSLLKFPRYRRICENFFAATVVIIFLVALIQYKTNSFGFTTQFRSAENLIELKNMGEKIRVASLFKHTFALIEFNMFAFPFVVAAYLTAINTRVKVITGLIAGMIVITTVWSQQRTGLVVIFLQMMMIFFFSNKTLFNKESLVKFLKLLLLVSCLFLIVMETEYGRELVQRIVNSFINPTEVVRDAGSTLVRIRRIQIAWNIFLTYPLFGSGLGTSPEMFDKFGWNFILSTGGPHNLYLFLLSETGIFSFLAFMYAWLMVFLRFFKSRMGAQGTVNLHAVAGIVFCITVLLDGMFSGLLIGASLTYFGIFLVYGYSLLAETGTERS